MGRYVILSEAQDDKWLISRRYAIGLVSGRADVGSAYVVGRMF